MAGAWRQPGIQANCALARIDGFACGVESPAYNRRGINSTSCGVEEHWLARMGDLLKNRLKIPTGSHGTRSPIVSYKKRKADFKVNFSPESWPRVNGHRSRIYCLLRQT